MQLKFKYQKFQADCAKAVCDVFEGQPYKILSYLVDKGISTEKQLELQKDLLGLKNNPIIIPDRQILENLQKIQRNNGIKPVEHLEPAGKLEDLTIEMETGVGKTYTYIKTIFELNKKYGWSKFIVVVPSIAIREGVYKSFEITQNHFHQDYGKKIRFFIYNSAKLNNIEQFASDSRIHVMIINTQAFAATGKDARRRISMKLDSFRSRRPIDVIAATNPILIIDEPQSVEGKTTVQKLKDFRPLFTLRYSATHRKDRIFNKVYSLDAMDAYNKKLVKKISVKGISVSGDTGTNGYLYLAGLNLSNTKAPTANLEFNVKGRNGLKSIVKKVDEGFNLYEQSGHLEEYKGYTVSKIDARTDLVLFSNGIKINVGQVLGDTQDSDQVRRIQIRETILSHIEREHLLHYKGIKVLSLFFIDEVAKYKDYSKEDTKGIYAHIFEEEYAYIVNNYIGELGEGEYVNYLKSIKAQDTHAGYFSIDKKSNHFIDSKFDKKEQGSNDIDAYDLIMKNKENLLDINNDVRFIFSHSALKEGWDNPNVFQICTLKKSDSEVRKRQEVGRGLRLCVNQDGERIDGTDVHDVNILTVIANESYASFSKGLQEEFAENINDRPIKVTQDIFKDLIVKDDSGNEYKIDEDTAISICEDLITNGYVKGGLLTDKYYTDKANNNLTLPDNVIDYKQDIIKRLDAIYNPSLLVEDARKNNVDIKINKDILNKKEFQNLWKKINIKSIYAVDFDSSELINRAITTLNAKLRIPKIIVNIDSGKLDKITSKQDLKEGTAFKKIDSKRETVSAGITSIKYDLIGKLVDETCLTRATIIKILKGIEKAVFEQFRDNPEEFIIRTANLINEQKATLIIEHITYTATDGLYETDIFTEPTIKGKLNINAIETPNKNLYDHLLFDSKIEKDFALNLESSENVVVYVKLPKGFYISTPVGKYNPDWAIAFDNKDVKHIYFIAETKGSMQTMQLRGIEDAKIKCAKKHFKAISNDEVQYDVVSNYEELLNKVMR